MIFQDPLSVEADKADVPFSILDTDLYKLTMQNAVLHHFPDAVVRIKFTNRAPQMLFSRESFHWIQDHVNQLERLRLSEEERIALAEACPYFSNKYLDFLASIRLHPRDQVGLRFIPKSEDERMGEIECTIEGMWSECILYEVPIMSILSEAYFKFVDQDWNMEGVKDKAKQKALELLNPRAPTQPLLFSEFGTRRRRSFYIHDLVVQGLKEGQDEWVAGGGKGGGLAGTSNVYLALKHGLKPMGTIAHEWIMAIGAVYGYKGSNGRAMDMWEEVYPRGENAAPLTMLTDTFTANAFFDDFAADTTRALRWDSLRQDSGDAFAFVKQAKEVWRGIEQEAGVKHKDGAVAVGKRVIFSDGLDVESAIALQKGCDEIGIAASFGIGTYLTNDFSKVSDSTKISKPLNIVIKLSRIDGHDCVKLSDDKGKLLLQDDHPRRQLQLTTSHRSGQAERQCEEYNWAYDVACHDHITIQPAISAAQAVHVQQAVVGGGSQVQDREMSIGPAGGSRHASNDHCVNGVGGDILLEEGYLQVMQ